MGFFDRNRDELEAKGYDKSRLPPGQFDVRTLVEPALR